MVTDSREAAPPASIAMNINSRPATTEKRLPCVFSVELLPFNEGRSLGTKFLPGGSTKLQCGRNQILTHKPDQNTAVSVTLPVESSPSHKELGLRPQIGRASCRERV